MKKNVEKEINIIDLFLYLVSKSVSIVVVLIIGMIAALFIANSFRNKAEEVGYNKKVAETEIAVASANEALVEYPEQIYLEGFSLGLTDNDRDIIKDYLKRKRKIEIMNYVKKRDSLMKLDYTRVYYLEAYYLIETEADVKLIEDQYKMLISLNNEISSLIKFVDEYNGEVTTEEEIAGSNNRVLMHISVLGSNEKSAENNFNIVNDIINNNKRNIEEKFGKYSISLNKGDIYYKFDEDVYNYQKTFDGLLNDHKTQQAIIRGGLTDQGEAYLKEYLRLEDEDLLPAENVAKIEMPEVERDKISIAMKDIMLGLVPSILLIAFYCVVYIISPYININDNIADMYDIAVIGKLGIGNNKGLKKLRYKKFYKFDKAEQIDKLSTNIKIMANKANIESIYMFSLGHIDNEEELVSNIKEKLVDYNITVDGHGSIVDSCEALDKSVNADAIIVMVNDMATKYVDFEEVLEQCKLLDSKIMGVVLLA